MNIVILDGYTTNPGDLNWNGLNKLGKVEVFDRTAPHLIIERSKNADILISNKVVFDKSILDELPQLKCICVLATGYNNVDIELTKSRNIPVCNVAGYSTNSVAQHVFALILALSNEVKENANQVRKGEWQNSIDWTYQLSSTFELCGKTLGIYGFGRIGKKVAQIGLAFGMRIISLHKHPERDKTDGVEFVSKEKLFSESDFLTLHAPLSINNKGFINADTLKCMKKSAYLINTGRGGLVNEEDLRNALESGIIQGAGLDVLSEEPPRKGNVLIGAKNCIITPHQAWGSVEARQTLIEETIKNVEAFLEGNPRNVVNK